jgi:hypothetical protein
MAVKSFITLGPAWVKRELITNKIVNYDRKKFYYIVT